MGVANLEAKVELLEGDEGQEADTRGLQKTYYLAWEHEDLKHPSNRYRDMPEEQGRDWAGLVNNVIGGIALTAGAAALAYAAPYALAGTKIGAVVLKGLSAAQAGQKLGAAVFLAGSMSVIGLGVSDFMSNRVSSREEYLRRAMAGAISGFLSGASTLALSDAGLAAVMGGGFAEGFVSEAITEKLLDEDGEIDWAQCIQSGVFTALIDGILYGTFETKKVSTDEKEFTDNPFDENGKLKPNVKYQTGEYNYNYETDANGRISNWNTDNLQLTKRTERLKHDSNTPGKVTGDHAGHLAGDRFGGSEKLDNIVTQSQNVNLSQYKKIENQWAKAIKEGKEVGVNVEIRYDGSGLRPIEFIVEYTIDGEYFCQSILN